MVVKILRSHPLARSLPLDDRKGCHSVFYLVIQSAPHPCHPDIYLVIQSAAKNLERSEFI
ncbi:MAG: hypothetical protein WAO23_05905 [Dethiobacteria bacterium]